MSVYENCEMCQCDTCFENKYNNIAGNCIQCQSCDITYCNHVEECVEFDDEDDH